MWSLSLKGVSQQQQKAHTLNNINRKSLQFSSPSGGSPECVWVFLGPEAPGPARTLPFSFGPGAPVVLALSETARVAELAARPSRRGAGSGFAPSCCCSHSPGEHLGSQGLCGSLPGRPQGGSLGLTVSKLLVCSSLWFLLLKDLVEYVKCF